MGFYVYKSFAESPVLIGLKVLSFECSLYCYPQCQSLHTLRFSRKNRRTTGARQNCLFYV
jgi:hypothetical protein